MTALETLSPALPDDLCRQVLALLQRASDLEVRLATAESCTGGLLASVLTDVQGASHTFERGFITYTDEAKHELLDVPLELIESEGAVSRLVALRMAEGGLRNSKADFCIAVTGFADDAGGKAPAGLVHFALATRKGETLHCKEEYGDIGRGAVRIEAARTAIAMLAARLAA